MNYGQKVKTFGLKVMQICHLLDILDVLLNCLKMNQQTTYLTITTAGL